MSSFILLCLQPYLETNAAAGGSDQYGQAGAQKCQYDYLLLDGMRFCGIRLNPNAINENSEQDMPVIDRSNGPFSARFVTNQRWVGRGFKLNFQQNPCGTRIPGFDLPSGG